MVILKDNQIINKICIKCELEKSIDRFISGKTNGKIYYRNICKDCNRIYHRVYQNSYYRKNAESLRKYDKQLRIKNKEKNKAQRIKNKNKKYLRDKIYRQSERGRTKIAENARKRKRNNLEEFKRKRNDYVNKKRKMDPCFKLRISISRTITMALKNAKSSKFGKSIMDYLPYTIEELKIYLEKQFEPWMTWKNHGNYVLDNWDDNDPSTWVWQLDHIIPKYKLLYSSMEDENFKKCWALENLRPLSAKQNIIDGVRRNR